MRYILLLLLLLTSCASSDLDFNEIMCYPIDEESGACTANFYIIEEKYD